MALSFLEFWLITVTMSCYNNFLQEHAQPLEVAFYIFNTCFFGLDMFIQSRTAYRTPGGTIQDDRKTIQRNYLRRGLAVDLIMVIPWALLLLPSMQPAAWQLGRVTRLFSPLRANKLFEWSNSLEQMPGSTAVFPPSHASNSQELATSQVCMPPRCPFPKPGRPSVSTNHQGKPSPYIQQPGG